VGDDSGLPTRLLGFDSWVGLIRNQPQCVELRADIRGVRGRFDSWVGLIRKQPQCVELRADIRGVRGRFDSWGPPNKETATMAKI
jgi:hypothetical protein